LVRKMKHRKKTPVSGTVVTERKTAKKRILQK
jgi:hypothetical protein